MVLMPPPLLMPPLLALAPPLLMRPPLLVVVVAPPLLMRPPLPLVLPPLTLVAPPLLMRPPQELELPPMALVPPLLLMEPPSLALVPPLLALLLPPLALVVLVPTLLPPLPARPSPPELPPATVVPPLAAADEPTEPPVPPLAKPLEPPAEEVAAVPPAAEFSGVEAPEHALTPAPRTRHASRVQEELCIWLPWGKIVARVSASVRLYRFAAPAGSRSSKRIQHRHIPYRVFERNRAGAAALRSTREILSQDRVLVHRIERELLVRRLLQTRAAVDHDLRR